MRIVVTTLDGNLYPLEVSSDLEIINLKALCEQETNIPISEISLTYDGQPLNDDTKTLDNYGIKENDIIMAQKIMTSLPLIDFSSIQVPSTAAARPSASSRTSATAATQFRDMLLSDRTQFAALQQRFPQLASAIQRGDMNAMQQFMGQLGSNAGLAERTETPSDLFDRDAQEKIAEAIRLQNVQQNMESALEHMPEAFGHIVMLYINCRVNGHPVKAFVDSGAQMTIMSGACAERCGIMRLVDKRWAGIAKGVGTQKIIGRVHLAQIQIENTFLPTAFSILEDQPMDMLLGLDLLRRHQCIIDLEQNALVIKSADIQTRFLSEAELPNFARSHSAESMEEEQLTETLKSSMHASSQAQPSTSQGAAVANTSNHSEDKIRELISLGFSRNDSVNALNACNGDVNMAKIHLISKSIQLPGSR